MNRFVFRIALIFILALFSLNDSIKSQNWTDAFNRIGKEDGLPSNIIYCVISDLDGVLWIGTDAGLVRYTGSTFKIYTIDDGLPSNDIFDLICDSKNRIWIKSMSKVVTYVKNGIIYNDKNDTLLKNLKSDIKIIDIFEDKYKSIWIVSFPFTLFKIDSLKRVVKFELSKEYDVCFHSIRDDSSITFVNTHESIKYLYSKNTFHPIRTSPTYQILDVFKINERIYYLDTLHNLKSINSRINKSLNFKSKFHGLSVFKGLDGLIWVVVPGSIRSYNKDNASNYQEYLSNLSPSYYHLDINQNSWIGTLGNGLFKLYSNDVAFQKNILEINSNRTHSVFTNSSKVFVGCERATLYSFSKQNSLKHSISEFSFSGHEKIHKIIKINKNLLGLIINSKILIFDLIKNKINKQYKIGACKNAILKGNELIVLTNYSISTINLLNDNISTSIFGKRFYSYTTYLNDTLLGSEDGLYSYNNKVLANYKLSDSLKSRIMDMQVKDSLLILATVDKGVYFIKNHKIIKVLVLKNGLSSNNCSKMQLYKNKLYIGTNKGISIYNFSNNTIQTLYESDGLASNMVNDFSIENDTMYAATDNGLSILALQNIPIRRPFPLFNKPTCVGMDTIWEKTKSFQTRTDFPFTVFLNSLSFQTKGNVLYYYRYKQNDSIFKETSDQNIPLYFSVPGHYVFEAFALDANNNKSQVLTLRIYVKPYFWQTLWFKILVAFGILVFLSIVFLLLLKRVKYLEEQKRQRDTKMHHLELSAWRSKINPHFLFNSLNTLQYLFTSNKAERANDYMTSFSKILRTTIDNSGKLLNSVRDEYLYMEKYLNLESYKRNEHFVFTITFGNENIKNYYIPSLLIQPVVENSLKHGLKSNDIGRIDIHFEEDEESIICTIKDNGKGFEEYFKLHPEHKSQGIQLIQDKIRILENVLNKKILFTFETLFDQQQQAIGSITTFVFPILAKNTE